MIRSETARIGTEECYEKTMVRLPEPQAPDSVVTISQLPSDAIIVKADAFPPAEKLLQNVNGIHKRADYLIISEERKCVIFIEQKLSKGSSWSDIVSQLKGSVCVFEYLRSIGQEFWEKADFLTKYRKHFVVFRHTNIAKRPTAHNAQPKNDTPDRALKLTGNHPFHFKQFLVK